MLMWADICVEYVEVMIMNLIRKIRGFMAYAFSANPFAIGSSEGL